MRRLGHPRHADTEPVRSASQNAAMVGHLGTIEIAIACTSGTLETYESRKGFKAFGVVGYRQLSSTCLASPIYALGRQRSPR